MKIRSAVYNNRKKLFEVRTPSGTLMFPYVKADPRPTARDQVIRAFVDDEIGREGFGYELRSGGTGTVHVEQVLEYNRDPKYLRNLLLYKLTLEARRRARRSRVSKREIARRLGTSVSQLYRLLDQTNERKSVDQLLALLQVLECDVGLVVRARTA